MIMPYKIYTTFDASDTSRDPDEIRTKELCYKNKKEDAVKFCENYIKENFCRKKEKLQQTKNGFEATDFCSYAETIIAEHIVIE